MAKENQNFEVFQGDDKQVTFTIYDENDALLTVTGYALNWVLYDEDELALITKTEADGLVVGTPASKVVLTLEPDDTLNIEEGFYPHELEITSPAGKVSTVTTGLVKVSYSKA